jgi:hypothetical protein
VAHQSSAGATSGRRMAGDRRPKRRLRSARTGPPAAATTPSAPPGGSHDVECSVSVVARGDLFRAEASHSSNSGAASASAPTGAGAGYGASPAMRHGRRASGSRGPAARRIGTARGQRTGCSRGLASWCNGEPGRSPAACWSWTVAQAQ